MAEMQINAGTATKVSKANHLRKSRNTALPALKPRTCNEEKDGYPHVVARLSAELRVIRSSCDSQWIVQRKYPSRWSGHAFCGTKEGLLRRLPKNGHDCDPEAWKIIEALPRYYTKVA